MNANKYLKSINMLTITTYILILVAFFVTQIYAINIIKIKKISAIQQKGLELSCSNSCG